jgi:hypothetical protein
MARKGRENVVDCDRFSSACLASQFGTFLHRAMHGDIFTLHFIANLAAFTEANCYFPLQNSFKVRFQNS